MTTNEKNEMTLWKVLDFEGHDLPVFEIEGEKYWFARDVGKVLEYGDDGGNLVRLINQKWAHEFLKREHIMVARGKDLKDLKQLLQPRNQKLLGRASHLTLLTKAGARLAALKSGKEVGVRLRRLLAGPVMDSIEKTGSYTVEQTPEFRKPKNMIEALEGWLAECKKTELLELQIAEDAPDVAFAKVVKGSVGAISFAIAAKILSEKVGIKLGQQRLFAYCRDKGFLESDNTPYQRYRENGYFDVKINVILGKFKPQPLITGLGLSWLAKRMLSENVDKLLAGPIVKEQLNLLV